MSRGAAERSAGEEPTTATAVEQEGTAVGGDAPGGGTASGDRSDAVPDALAVDSGGSEPSDSATPISQDDVFEVLSNRRRRLVFEHLLEHEEGVDLAEISKRIAAREEGCTPGEICYADRKSVHTALYQFHLPKMQSAGFVDYDRRAGHVELTPAARVLDVSIETGGGGVEPNWSGRFLLLSTGGGLLAGASWLDLVPAAVLPGSLCAVLVAALFLGASVAFASSRR